jgi:hypothetical protein
MKSIAISLIILMTATSVVHAENYVMKQTTLSDTSSATHEKPLAPGLPSKEQENTEILASADSSGVYPVKIGSYTNLGNVWISPTRAFAVSAFPADSRKSTYVVKTTGGKYFTYSDFFGNPYTGSSQGAISFYINGASMHNETDPAGALLSYLGNDAKRVYFWESLSMSAIEIEGVFYRFDNPSFSIDRVWTE